MYQYSPKSCGGGGILQPPVRKGILIQKTPIAQQGLNMDMMNMQKMIPIKAQLNPTLPDTKTLAPMATGGDPMSMGAGLQNQLFSGLASAGTQIIDATQTTEFDQYGNQAAENMGSAVSKGALTGAASGAMFGPIGAGVGAVIGGGISYLNNKKEQKTFNKAHAKSQAGFIRNQDAQQFAAMSAKDGMKFDFQIQNKILSTKRGIVPIFKKGGKLTTSIIAGGKLHKENNNLGDGDKGIPVINSDGVKVVEVEKEEWIMSAEVTKQVEDMAKNYKLSNKSADLEGLGKFVATQLLKNTIDNSDGGRYKIGSK